MGAIVLDASKVNSYVLPNLTKSKNIILSACSINNALRNSLPNSFSYKNYISNIATQLYNIQKEISNINQIIIKKIEKAKSIESSGQNRTAAISRIASSIGAISGTVGGAMIGSTGGVAGAVIGATIGNKVGKTIGNTGAKIVGKTVSGIKIVGSSIVNGFKWIGSKVTKAYKSATNWISDKAKKVSNWVVGKLESAKNWTCKALKDTGAFISKVGTTIWSGLKKAWNWAKDVENWKRLGASIANGAIAFVKGVVSLVEALGDLIILIGSGICTTRTALYDLGKGIVTGNWNFDATKGLWKKTKSIVSYQWTNKAFDAFYETKAGKWLDSNAYKPFKSDGMGCEIIEGVGYIAGIIALTIATFGAGSAVATVGGTTAAGVSSGLAVGSAAASVTGATFTITTSSLAAGGIAAAAGMGKNTAAAWNDGASVLSGLGYGVAKGAYEGFEMTVGYAINGLKIFKGAGALSQVGNSMSHVALDAIDGGSGALIDPLFMMIYSPNQKNLEDIMKYVNYDANGNKLNDKKWNDLSFSEKYNAIFQYKGGWNTVATQAVSAAAMSFLSEVPEISGALKASRVVKKVSKEGITATTTASIKKLDDNSLKGVIEQSKKVGNFDDVVKQLDDKFEKQNFSEIIDKLISKEKNVNGKIAGQELYKKLGYNGTPKIVTANQFSSMINNSEYGTIFRGIQGDNALKYADQFINGDMYVGGTRGAIYGTGIYTAYGKDAYSNIGLKYATNAGATSKGIVLEMLLSNDAKVIKLNDLLSEQEKVLNSLSKSFNKYSPDIVDLDSLINNLSKIKDRKDLIKAKYIVNTLSDPGYYASIRGFDAIDVVDKSYLTILNRNKIIISDETLKINNIASNTDLDELAFFKNNQKFNKNIYDRQHSIDLNITPLQRQTVDQINNFIKNGRGCIVTYNSTSEISSVMLDQIDDLSQVQIKILDGLGDSSGSLKAKYVGKPRYDARITYNGYEMKAILEKIEFLQSKIDMSLPIEQRAKQIYEILSTEVPAMWDYENYADGHLVSASLRGLIPNNSVGKEGLVCAGYASVYKELCERVGIKCDYVRGIGITDPLRNGGRGGHAWNVVYTDDGIIPVDVTWKATRGDDNWFGGSNEFVSTHIADADEISKNFENMIPSIKFKTSTEKLEKVLLTLDNKYGNRQESIKRLRNYVNNHNPNEITRTDDARNIILTIDDITINNFILNIDVYSKLDEITYVMDQKHGQGYGLAALRKYIETGNLNLITRTNGARDMIKTLSFEDIERYILKK